MKLKKYLDSLETVPDLITLVGPINPRINQLKGLVLYVDGGADYGKNNQGFVVGDGDSSTAQMNDLLPAEKDYSDLAYTLHQLKFRAKNLHLTGFLGGRSDHELMNLAEVHNFLLSQTENVRVEFDDQIIAFSQGEWVFKKSGVFSLFCFETTLVTLSGDIKYSLANEELKKLSSHGLSNVSQGQIRVKANAPLFIFFEQD